MRPSIIAGKARLLPPGWQHIQKDGRLNLSSSCHPIFRLDWPPNSRSVSNSSLDSILHTDYISFKCCHRLPNRALRSGLGFPVVRSFEIGEGLPLPAHQLAPHKPGNGRSWCSGKSSYDALLICDDDTSNAVYLVGGCGSSKPAVHKGKQKRRRMRAPLEPPSRMINYRPPQL